MANVPHFSVGGSIHLVVNNQVSDSSAIFLAAFF
jgi:2-oxoglutarate dehydrogenase complex dehydrogenase (E1) component-like enzyme